jgi:hypothetical protein
MAFFCKIVNYRPFVSDLIMPIRRFQPSFGILFKMLSAGSHLTLHNADWSFLYKETSAGVADCGHSAALSPATDTLAPS